jgi:hypothetical protein
MASLKAYIPALARQLGSTPATIYERQRALVRAGLLDQSEGRGPGSGVKATPPSVALLVISALAGDNLADSVTHAAAIAEATPRGRKQKFIDAFADVLASAAKAADVREVCISRTADRAIITHKGGVSEFSGASSTEPGVAVSVTLSRNVLKQLSEDVRAMLAEAFDSSEDAAA